MCVVFSMCLFCAIVYNNYKHHWQRMYQNVTSSGISSSIVYKYNVQYKTLNIAKANGNKTRAHASIRLPLSGAQSSSNSYTFKKRSFFFHRNGRSLRKDRVRLFCKSLCSVTPVRSSPFSLCASDS